MSKPETTIDVGTLAIGHYVYLDISWLDHPFAFGHFKITSEDQLATIRSLGLKKVRVDLAKSQVVVASPTVTASLPTPDELQEAAAREVAMLKKRERIAQNQALRSKIATSEKKFVESAKICKDIGRTIFSSPAESIGRANAVINQLAGALLDDTEAIIYLLGDKVAGEEIYHHALNVATLAVLLGKELKMSREAIEQIGLATILHDLGKTEIPDRVLLKKDALTKPERELYQTHVMHSVAIAKKAGVAKDVLLIIAQHHEMIDGTGFPGALKAQQLLPGAKLLSLINAYDNLCNPTDIAAALTPHEALSLMFTKQRTRYDPTMLGKMVHLLGVYPPGTVVVLSNESIGMVISINASKPLRPTVIVYDPDIPRAEAVIINLEEEKDININKALRPAQLARPVYDYLSPRQRITYSFDASVRSGT
jgi:putative nucleotidyltransferase with HDIG domain